MTKTLTKTKKRKPPEKKLGWQGDNPSKASKIEAILAAAWKDDDGQPLDARALRGLSVETLDEILVDIGVAREKRLGATTPEEPEEPTVSKGAVETDESVTEDDWTDTPAPERANKRCKAAEREQTAEAASEHAPIADAPPPLVAPGERIKVLTRHHGQEHHGLFSPDTGELTLLDAHGKHLETYTSPSAAGRQITQLGSFNGWGLWRIAATGQPIDVLRGGEKRRRSRAPKNGDGSSSSRAALPAGPAVATQERVQDWIAVMRRLIVDMESCAATNGQERNEA